MWIFLSRQVIIKYPVTIHELLFTGYYSPKLLFTLVLFTRVFGTLFVSEYYSRVTIHPNKIFYENNDGGFTVKTVELLGSKSTVIRVVA